MKYLLPFLFLGLGFAPAWAQKKNSTYNYFIKRATSTIKVDGQLDEQAWKDASVASNFWQIQPMDTSRAIVNTEVMLCYDDKNIYVTFINYNRKEGGKYVVESMRRDFNFGRNDNDLLFIDTFEDQTNGFSFGSNAMGGQWDGLMANGGSINLSWDNKWQSEVTYDEDKWIWEAAIPFKTLRYKEGVQTWGINFSRLDLKTNEKSSWAPVPRQFPSASLAYTGNLIWDVPPPKPGSNVSIIPFVTANQQRNFTNQTPGTRDFDFGVDAKVGLTSALNLDVTVNPDFSQVEVDVQQTNLDRFELFFPERRQFFLENGDIFNDFGFSNLRPFFSRRIGLNSPIKYGGRISGKLNPNVRIGVLHMQTGEDEKQTPGSHYSVVSLQRKVFKRSFISGIFANRQTAGTNENPVPSTSLADFNRTLGLEYNLASSDNIWTGKAMYLKTFSPLSISSSSILAGQLRYSARQWNYGVKIEQVGGGVQANEMGFVRRRDYAYISPEAGYQFFPKSDFIVSHGPRIRLNYYFDKEVTQQIENEKVFIYSLSFLNRSELFMWLATDYVKLLAPFDPTNFTGQRIEAGTEHSWSAIGGNFTSKPKSLFTYSLSSRYGGYYGNGDRLNINGQLGYRLQPYAAISFNADYNQIKFGEDARLPELLKNSQYNLLLVGSRTDITLSNKLFFTNFVQFNNQTNNVNLNTRLQWRYSPASDLFLVYTDNYLADTWQVRNRQLVLKFTYWWNL